MTSQACSLARNTFHGTSIAKEYVCVVVDQVEPWLIELGRRVSLGNGETNAVGETLAQRAGSDLNTISI